VVTKGGSGIGLKKKTSKKKRTLSGENQEGAEKRGGGSCLQDKKKGNQYLKDGEREIRRATPTPQTRVQTATQENEERRESGLKLQKRAGERKSIMGEERKSRQVRIKR